jgi:hypothetical protein
MELTRSNLKMLENQNLPKHHRYNSSRYSNSQHSSSFPKSHSKIQKVSPSLRGGGRLIHFQIPKNMNPLTSLDITLLRARQQLHIYHILKKLREDIQMACDDDQIIYENGDYVSYFFDTFF